MKKALAFSDVLIVPGFSDVKSRKDVSLDVEFMGEKLTLPVLSAPMDTVTNAALAIELHKAGGLACLHRFQPIGDNVVEFGKVSQATGRSPVVSVGLNDSERLDALVAAGANKVLLDVAHGGMQSVVDWANETNKKYPDLWLMLGNYSTAQQLHLMTDKLTQPALNRVTWRMGVGSGSGCLTRVVTGCGMPTFASVQDVQGYRDIVADGGIKTPGDVCKALAAGASIVMLGGMLAGTTESPGDVEFQPSQPWTAAERMISTLVDPSNIPMGGGINKFKRFRGSAAASSYKDQGKEWATAEGEEFLVSYKGPVKNVLAEIEGGLRSCLTYTGVDTLTNLSKNATFVEVSYNGTIESGAHGKRG